jgi:hypothetical protein
LRRKSRIIAKRRGNADVAINAGARGRIDPSRLFCIKRKKAALWAAILYIRCSMQLTFHRIEIGRYCFERPLQAVKIIATIS